MIRLKNLFLRLITRNIIFAIALREGMIFQKEIISGLIEGGVKG